MYSAPNDPEGAVPAIDTPGPPPDGYVVCEHYPEPGRTILLWQPAPSRFETSSWVPARVKDRRIRGSSSREVRPDPGYGRPFSVRNRPVNHYATPETQ